MKRLLVIGYGNELRGDDAVGPCAARVVAEWGLPGVTALAVPQLTPELALALKDVDRVVFVDAGAELDVRRLEAATGTCAGHTSDPHGLLALTEALYVHRPEAWLLTIPVTDFELGAPLSLAAQRGLAVALRRLSNLIRKGGENELSSGLHRRRSGYGPRGRRLPDQLGQAGPHQ
jgi:hydrogenase maturation protease